MTGYQLRWKETAASDTAATTANDPSTGWVEGGAISSSSLSQTVTGLTNGTGYDVQVRATDGTTAGADGDGYGAWTATQSGTPVAKEFGLSPTALIVPPGTEAEFTVVLTEAAPAGGLEVTATRLLGDDVPTGTCTGYTKADADDVAGSTTVTVTFSAGETEAELSYATADNGDDLVGGRECFAVRLSTTAAGWTAADGRGWVGRIERRAADPFGDTGSGTAKHALEVAENVTGVTVNVPVRWTGCRSPWM